MIILETQRLSLREMTPHDAENAYLLNLDPDVLKYTGDAPFGSIEEARNFLLKYDHYKKNGFGRWAVINNSTHEFIGWCGLRYVADKNEYDVGYRLNKIFWNKGYATEAAKACIDIGFIKFNIKRIIGNVMKENIGSIRVLEKIGMTYYKDEDCGQQPGMVYEIKKKQ